MKINIPPLFLMLIYFFGLKNQTFFSFLSGILSRALLFFHFLFVSKTRKGGVKLYVLG